jgi:hypothetical protein
VELNEEKIREAAREKARSAGKGQVIQVRG